MKNQERDQNQTDRNPQNENGRNQDFENRTQPSGNFEQKGQEHQNRNPEARTQQENNPQAKHGSQHENQQGNQRNQENPPITDPNRPDDLTKKQKPDVPTGQANHSYGNERTNTPGNQEQSTSKYDENKKPTDI